MASAKTLSVGASVALDDNVIQSQKYTSLRRLQLFLNVLAPLASTRSPNPVRPAGVRARRGGDRITTLFAALHESVAGTFETCRRTLTMSVYRGNSDSSVEAQNDAIDP
jgi:hypothetical protein